MKSKTLVLRLKKVVTGKHWMDETEFEYYIGNGFFRFVHTPYIFLHKQIDYLPF